MPAAVITALRGRWLYFWCGFLTAGVVWFVGAFARGPGDPPRTRRWMAIALLAPLASILVLGLFGARPAPVLGLTGRALQSSVGNDIPILESSHPCQPEPGGAWSCSRWDAGRSGTVPYRVTADGLGCWRAVRDGYSGEGSPKALHGCVTLGNYLLG